MMPTGPTRGDGPTRTACPARNAGALAVVMASLVVGPAGCASQPELAAPEPVAASPALRGDTAPTNPMTVLGPLEGAGASPADAGASTDATIDAAALWSVGADEAAGAGWRRRWIAFAPVELARVRFELRRIADGGRLTRVEQVEAEPAPPASPAPPAPSAPDAPAPAASAQGLAPGQGGERPDESSRRVLELALADDGTLRLLRTVEAGEDAVTVFDPPMLVLPTRLAAGAVHEHALQMVVRSAGAGEAGDAGAIKSQGPATRRVTIEGRQRIATPAGEVTAWRVLGELAAQLGPAQVRVTTRSWYAPGRGLLAEETLERVTVFGVPARSVRRGWVVNAEGPAIEPIP